MEFSTESGSVYQVDTQAKTIRRVSGSHPTRNNQGEDGEWRKYLGLSEVAEGKNVVIVWPVASLKGLAKTTTSKVVSVNNRTLTVS